MGSWEITTINEINQHKGTSVNPLSSPDTVYELYSVPSWDNNHPEIIRGADIGSSKQRVQKGDVLICKINPRINRVWVVEKHTNNDLIASSEWIVVRNSDIDSRYLMRYFQSPRFRNLLISEQSGIGGSLTRAQPKQVKNYPVPLPPLSVQQKIADVLDRASALIEKRKAQIEKLDLLVKSRFIEMFGDPVTNPMGWEVKKLQSLAHRITDGVHLKPNYISAGVPFISVVNITKRYIDFSNCKYVSQKDYEKMTKRIAPEYGDILYTKVGATYGIPAYIDTNANFGLYVSVCLIKPRHESINAKFLALSMGMPYIKRQADKRIKGIGVPDLHLDQIREFDILYPPLTLQNEFTAFAERIETQKGQLKKGLELLELNYKSLMQKCLGGGMF